MTVPVIRHIHSELFRELDNRRGEFRKGSIQIHGAKVTPLELEVEAFVMAALEAITEVVRSQTILPAPARAHYSRAFIHFMTATAV